MYSLNGKIWKSARFRPFIYACRGQADSHVIRNHKLKEPVHEKVNRS